MKSLLVPAWLAAAGFTLALASPAAADPLTVVDVNAPAYQFVFSTSGSVVVQDTVDTFAISGAAGLARLQSRTTQGQAGAPAAGLYRYSYRLDLTNVYGILDVPCVTSLTLRFGSVVNTLDYNGDGVTGDEVFVVTSGGLGSVGLASATRSGSAVTFNFADGGVCAGSSPGTGESSFFFGLVSTTSPRYVTATVADTSSNAYTPQARAPKAVFFVKGDIWTGALASPTPHPGYGLSLAIDHVANRRFEGTLTLGGASDSAPTVLAVAGAFSASGRMVLVGRGRGAQFSAGAVKDDGGLVFTGRYRLRMGNEEESGTLEIALDPRLLPVTGFEREGLSVNR